MCYSWLFLKLVNWPHSNNSRANLRSLAKPTVNWYLPCLALQAAVFQLHQSFPCACSKQPSRSVPSWSSDISQRNLGRWDMLPVSWIHPGSYTDVYMNLSNIPSNMKNGKKKKKLRSIRTTARLNHALASWVSVWSSSTCCITLNCLSA